MEREKERGDRERDGKREAESLRFPPNLSNQLEWLTEWLVPVAVIPFHR